MRADMTMCSMRRYGCRTVYYPWSWNDTRTKRSSDQGGKCKVGWYKFRFDIRLCKLAHFTFTRAAIEIYKSRFQTWPRTHLFPNCQWVRSLARLIGIVCRKRIPSRPLFVTGLMQVIENYSDFTKWRSTVFKYRWLVSHFIFNMVKRWYLMC